MAEVLTITWHYNGMNVHMVISQKIAAFLCTDNNHERKMDFDITDVSILHC